MTCLNEITCFVVCSQSEKNQSRVIFKSSKALVWNLGFLRSHMTNQYYKSNLVIILLFCIRRLHSNIQHERFTRVLVKFLVLVKFSEVRGRKAPKRPPWASRDNPLNAQDVEEILENECKASLIQTLGTFCVSKWPCWSCLNVLFDLIGCQAKAILEYDFGIMLNFSLMQCHFRIKIERSKNTKDCVLFSFFAGIFLSRLSAFSSRVLYNVGMFSKMQGSFPRLPKMKGSIAKFPV